MIGSPLEILLTPSLDKSFAHQPMYSITAHVMVAFFAGPLGLAVFYSWSLRKAGLLKRHWFLSTVMVVVSFAALIYMAWSLEFGLPAALQIGSNDMQSVKYLVRIAGLVMLAGLHTCYKSYFITSTFTHQQTPSPWIAGVVCLVIHIIVFSVIAALFQGIN